MTTNQAAPSMSIITDHSDPSEVINAIIHLSRRLGQTMLSDVANHTATTNGTTVEEEYLKFTSRIDTVAREYKDLSNKLYTERDEMLGTMVLASLMHSIQLLNAFEEACEVVIDEENEAAQDSLELNTFDIPEGMGVALAGSKHEH